MTHVIHRFTTGCVIVTTALLCSPGVAEDGGPGETANLRLTLRDTKTGELVPGRITVEQQRPGEEPDYHFVQSLDPAGTAVPYDVTRSATSFEKHTTVSAHPCGANVPPGNYTVYYEHGPEWRGNKAQVTVEAGQACELELPTSRWIDLNARGWYSGDTHVHRPIEDLPNIMRAEDLNVALPLSYWVRDAYTPPSQGDKTVAVQPELITVDPNRVIWPMNTEYELFTLNGQRHTQGAVFVLNHNQPLTLAAPPVAPIAAEARRQGALLDLDKHTWPWSLMVVPIMDVNLFELSNNHIWRTDFHFQDWTIDTLPEDWNIETDEHGWTEWGWIDFGFKTYYALLNCGFKLRPSAGTASGVHPVPLGYGRVYVKCPDTFSYDKWMQGLAAGRSFVTTGPMLFVTVDDHPQGSTFIVDGPGTVRVQGSVETIDGFGQLEIIRNGRVVDVIRLEGEYESPWIRRSTFDVEVPVETTSWIAVRCFTDKQVGNRKKLLFAHSSPVHVAMPGRPLHARKIETDYLVRRVTEEISRNRDLLGPDELAEYQRARNIYALIGETAVEDHVTSNAELESLVIPPAALPRGWELTDIAQTDWKELGSNPAIVSNPIFHRGVLWGDQEHFSRANVLRSLLVFYGDAHAPPHVTLVAHVCADETSARYAAEFLNAPPNQRGRFHTWQRGDLVVWLMAGTELSDADFANWIDLVAARFSALK